MVKDRRRIVGKPSTPPPAADAWVTGGGLDPELSKSTSQLDVQMPDTRIPDVQTSKHLDVEADVRAKSQREDYKRTTIYLSKILHKRLKAAALDRDDMDMSDIAEIAILEWLDKRLNV